MLSGFRMVEMPSCPASELGVALGKQIPQCPYSTGMFPIADGLVEHFHGNSYHDASIRHNHRT